MNAIANSGTSLNPHDKIRQVPPIVIGGPVHVGNIHFVAVGIIDPAIYPCDYKMVGRRVYQNRPRVYPGQTPLNFCILNVTGYIPATSDVSNVSVEAFCTWEKA